jgi:hypothetical protein
LAKFEIWTWLESIDPVNSVKKPILVYVYNNKPSYPAAVFTTEMHAQALVSYITSCMEKAVPFSTSELTPIKKYSSLTETKKAKIS